MQALWAKIAQKYAAKDMRDKESSKIIDAIPRTLYFFVLQSQKDRKAYNFQWAIDSVNKLGPLSVSGPR